MLMPLIAATIDVYKKHHPDLIAVYLVGSVTVGEWRVGVSDLDVIGITQSPAPQDCDSARREEFLYLGDATGYVSFIDSTVICRADIEDPARSHGVQGELSKLSLSGINAWGETFDFSDHVPSFECMVFNRMDRARLLMEKYRAGNLIEPFRKDARLLTRSSAKAAMRVLSSITLLRGAAYHPSPYRTSEIVEIFVPEAAELNKQILAIINNPIVPPETAMRCTDKAVELFHRLIQQHQNIKDAYAASVKSR